MLLRPLYLYVTSFLLGFILITSTVDTPINTLKDKSFENFHTVTGVVENYDTETDTIRFLTFDALRFESVSSSAQRIELKTTDRTSLIDQDLITENGVIQSITERSISSDMDLERGDFLVITYKNLPHGFYAERILRGKPMPFIEPLTPHYLQLQETLLGSPQVVQ